MASREPINFEFKAVQTENLERFTEMAELCFGLTNFSPTYFKWKYLDNPAGPVVAFEALHEGKPAGFYGVIPEHYIINGERVKIYQSMDTMTHPNYQKRGLFTRLATMTYDRCAEIDGGVNLVGIAGSNSLHGLLKLNWKNIHQFEYFFVQRTWFNARNLLQKKPAVRCEAVTEMTEALRDYFQRRERSLKPISNDISADFINWRVFLNTYKDFKVLQLLDGDTIVGICVYNLDEKGRCLIHLLDFAQQEMFKAYTAAMVDCLFEATCSRYVYTWKPLNPNMLHGYSACGFYVNPFQRGPFSYRVPFVVRHQGAKIGTADWFDPNNFDLQPLMQD
ncbi:MAG TPA: GNAT family N-acetyltransferase [Pyrinomonadaceae bacterium]|nr:GNAT family N-acetyltransferase [Pyrinomonadaceae bacterium]